MIKKIDALINNFNEKIESTNNIEEIKELKNNYIGKNSQLTSFLKDLKNLDQDKKNLFGSKINDARNKIHNIIENKINKINDFILNEKLKKEKIDITMSVNDFAFGTKHPLNIIVEEISDIFKEIGYTLVSGTEVEYDLYNFQKLNLPLNHPARDMQDTFYLSDNKLLRTHCTNMTSRMLTKLSKTKEKNKNLAVISYGNVYRRDDDDATHSHQFMQIDGFAVCEKMSFANLKWVLKYMCKRLFNESVNIRLRPSYFPFTEPSCEVDISCFKCNSLGCNICKFSGWIEILGSGMINRDVLKLNDLDPDKVSGIAFGIGIERIAMLKFGVSNIRDFYENNIKFLDQFKFYSE